MVASFYNSYETEQESSFVIKFLWNADNTVEVTSVDKVDKKMITGKGAAWREYKPTELPIESLKYVW